MAEADGVLPLTAAQRGVWFANRLDPDNPSYAIAECVRIPGELDSELFEHALRQVVAEIEVLRGSVVEDADGATGLAIAERIERLPFEFRDLSTLDEPESAAEQLIDALLDEPIDVTSAPAFSFTLLRLSEVEHRWVQRYHHVLLDGVGMTLVQRRVAECYTALVHGESVQAAEFQPSRALVDAELAYPDEERSARDRAYWTELLADRPEPASCAPSVEASAKRLLRGRTHLSPEWLSQLHAGAREIGVAWPSLLVAGFGLYVERVGGGNPVVLGLPVAARGPGLGEVPGMATNIVPLRLEPSAANSIEELARHTGKRLREAVKHQRYRYEQLRTELGLLADQQRLTGPQVNIVLFDYALDFAGVAGYSRNLAGGPVDELSLVIDARTEDGGVDLILDANPDAFTAAELDALAERLVWLFSTLAGTEGTGSVSTLDTTTPAERLRVLDTFAAPRQEIPETTLYAEFIAQARKTPDAPAVEHHGRVTSYAELAVAANGIARELIVRGVGPEDFVALAVPRCTAMMAGLLGVLGAGAAYLPVDPNYPAERIEYLLEDARPELVLTTEEVREQLPAGARVLSLDAREPDPRPVTDAERVRPLRPEHPAYAIYTSGSTGKPKGVIIAHRSAVDLAAWARASFGDALSRVLASTSLNFDVSVFEMFGPLTSGGRIEIVRDLLELAEREDRSWSGNLISAVPSALSALLEQGGLTLHADWIVLAGEALPGYLMRRIGEAVPGARIANIYGPTEACVYAAAWYGDPSVASPPIGAPLPNTGTYILDAALRPLPVGVSGELYLAGPGLARGYLGRPGLSAERFLADPFGAPGARMYRTGDLARWNEHGEIEYLGRVDDQIKIRGFRVELGEVETALVDQAGVARAAVVLREGRLIGYVVPDGAELDSALLRERLAERLPDYMVPAAIVELAELPLNTSGKLDRGRLPAPEFAEDGGREARTDAERTACGIAAEVLGIDAVSPEANFFSLGGDSIIAIQFVNRARAAGLELGPRQVFEHKTMERIAAAAVPVETQRAHQESAGAFALTPMMRRLAERRGPKRGYNQAVVIEAPADVRAEAVPELVRRLIDRHDAFRLRMSDVDAEVLPSGSVPASVREAETDDVVTLAEAARTRLDPERARMLEVVTLPGEPLRLLFVAHHAAVDGVSWRILLSELAEPAPVPVSARGWANQLAERDSTGELPYWCEQLAAGTAKPPAGEQRVRERISLGRALSERLLETVSASAHAGIDELLLTGLHLALPAIGVDSASSPLLVELERHGRQREDLDRTIGWLTSMHPVRLAPCGDSLDTLRAVKESMRATPGDGHGYGLLRYRDGELTDAARPWLAFNYLGRLDASESGWSLREAGVIPAAEPGLEAEHRLEVNVFSDGESLIAELELAGGDLRRLVEEWRHQLERIAEATMPGAAVRTPSDFPYAALDQDEVDRLEASIPELLDVVTPAPLAGGLVFHALAEETDVYSVQVCFELHGELDVERLHAATRTLVARHDALRSGFATAGLRAPVRCVLAALEPPFISTNVSEMDSDEIEALLAELREYRFDLAEPPLFRFDLLRLADARYRLVFTHHHTLLDGWSLPVLGAELFKLYSAPERLGPPPGYQAYARWLSTRDTKAAELAWRRYLDGLREPTLLAHGEPEGTPTPVRAELPMAAITRAAREQGVTVNSLVQTAWALTLSAATGSEDVVFGATVSGRPAELPGVERMVGLFINTVPVRAVLHPERSLAETARLLQQEQLGLREHQHTSLSAIQRVSGHGTLFDSLLVFENYPLEHAEFTPDGAGFSVTGVHGTDATHYPVTLNVTPGEELAIRLDHRCGAVDRPVAEALLESFTTALEALVSRGELATGRLRLTTEQLRTGSVRTLPRTTLPELFAQQLRRSPNATAVVFGERRWSYAEFDALVANLAGRLAERGVRRGERVAVAVPRSVELVTALYAVQRLGAAYVPVDPDYPAERIEFMLTDCAPSLLLTTESLAERLPGAAKLLVDVPEPAEPVHESAAAGVDTAYVIYTSGSTGRPKGAAIAHSAIVNRLLWMRSAYELDASDAILQKTPASFDVSVWEFFVPLLSGARLVLAEPEAHTDPEALARLIDDHEVTTVHFVPSMLQAFLASIEAGSCPSLRRVLCSGEALSAGTQRKFGELLDAELHNLYGPTEAAVDVTAWHCDPHDNRASVPIGEPVWNTGLAVLDGALRQVPAGVVGDLYLTGPQLADGYLGRAGLSAERFLADPFGAPGARMYRTGDLASVDSAGVLWFHGRADEQVKIRGTRVELGEVDAALAEAPGVGERAVLAGTDANDGVRLIAYLTGITEVEAVRAHLAERLPAAMVPGAFVVLDELPLTPSGKLDRKALPEPEFASGGAEAQGPLEALLCRLFAETLGLDEVGAHDGFFALGGDSISSIKLVALAKEHGLLCKPKDVFKHRTPAALASVCGSTDEERGAEDGIGTLPVPPIARALLERGGPIEGYHQSMLVRLGESASETSLRAAFARLLEHHEALRARLLPEGCLEVPESTDVAVLRVAEPGESVAEATELARTELDPYAGRMMRAVWFAERAELLLLVHHLVVDGVSWQVLLSDLRRAHESSALAPVPVSYRGWSHALHERSASLDPAHWRGLVRTEAPLGARRLDPELDTVATAYSCHIHLSTTVTERLLEAVTDACHARADEVLLAGLALAVRDWRGRDSVLAEIEGHGRDLLDDWDTGRTIGWFTTLFPVRIELGDARNADAVKLAKEHVRASAKAGGEYGSLRWSAGHTELDPGAEIGFNYLGRMPAGQGGEFEPLAEGIGGGADPAMPLAHALELTAVVGATGLRIEVLAAGRLFDARELEAFTAALRRALEQLAAHGTKGGGFTPSDLSLLDLDQDDIDELEHDLDEEWELSK